MTAPLRAAPPSSLGELRARAEYLAGLRLSELAARLRFRAEGPMRHRKGKAGELVERALGATGGSAQEHDFPHLRVELKTIPVDASGAPQESTFVCALSLLDADKAEWSTSWVRAKLSHVLWVPIVDEGADRRIGTPLFWSPTPEQEAILRGDFDEIMGIIGAGKVELLTARVGRWLQARPKAAHGRVRTQAYGVDDEPLLALPRGFYLRARFTKALFRDPTTLVDDAL